MITLVYVLWYSEDVKLFIPFHIKIILETHLNSLYIYMLVHIYSKYIHLFTLYTHSRKKYLSPEMEGIFFRVPATRPISCGSWTVYNNVGYKRRCPSTWAVKKGSAQKKLGLHSKLNWNYLACLKEFDSYHHDVLLSSNVSFLQWLNVLWCSSLIAVWMTLKFEHRTWGVGHGIYKYTPQSKRIDVKVLVFKGGVVGFSEV